jgi:streptomycin 6-kinase
MLGCRTGASGGSATQERSGALKIPREFAQKTTRTFGVQGERWLERIPALFAHCQEKWQLSDCTLVDEWSINLVFFAHSNIYGDVVLKLEGPHDERRTEAEALRLYSGINASRCFAVEGDAEALLLERIKPGRSLRALLDADAQVEVAADLVSRLPIELEGAHVFPLYAEWVERAFGRTRDEFNPSAAFGELLADAEMLFSEIDAAASRCVLLHGDLHHDNILEGENGQWKAIDPQGAVGAHCLEAARFIQNHAVESERGVVDIARLDHAIRRFAEMLEEDRRTIAAGVFVLDMLSTCWGYEMNYEPERIAAGIRASEVIRRYVRAL